MIINKEDMKKIQKFCQWIIQNPLPFDKQKFTRQGMHIWCRDWEIIEILKYLINGHDGYMGDPPPNRLKFNPLWCKEDIVTTGKNLLNSFDNVDEIIRILKRRRETKKGD